jgi:hypothetical protein
MVTYWKRMPMMTRLVFIAAAWFLGGVDGVSCGDDRPGKSDSVKAELEKARAIYRAKIAQIKTEVVLSLDRKIAVGRKKKNNSAIVATLTAEKKEFENDVNRLPPSLGKDRAILAKRANRARGELDAAYTRAVTAYTEAAQDPQAVAIKAEQAEFRSQTAAATSYQRTQVIVEQPVPMPAAPRPVMNPGILVHSEWNFTRRGGGVNQSGAFKILDGVIYHLDADHPIGVAALDAPGQLHLIFEGHRKIAAGEAVVQKVANGEWRGELIFLGGAWGFSMSRR